MTGGNQLISNYQYYFKNRERTGFRWMLFVMGLSVLVPIQNDFQFAKEPWVLSVIMVLRGLNLVGLTLVYLAFYRNWGHRIYQSLVLSLFIPAILLIVATDLTRPQDYLFGYTFYFLLISFYYFMLPASLWTKTVPSLVIALYAIWSVIFFRKYPLSPRIMIVVTFIGLNLFGFLNALVLQRLRETEARYLAELEDQNRFRQEMVDISFDAIVICSGDKVVDFNQRFLSLLDQKALEVKDLNLDSLMMLSEEMSKALLRGDTVRTVLSSSTGVFVPVEVRRNRGLARSSERSGFLLRDLSDELLTNGLPKAEITRARIKRLPLSDREKEIVTGILEGKSRYRIAEELFISDETVKKHTSNIYRKLELTSKVDLIRLLIEN